MPFGAARGLRRGRGSDVAGLRPYVAGDPVSMIDWRASAKLSTARGDDEFVVRERFAEEGPRVVVLCDRSPAMGLYPDALPWLSKPHAVTSAVDAILASAAAARGTVGYLDFAGVAGHETGEPYWVPPRARVPASLIVERQLTARYDAPDNGPAAGLEFLSRLRSALPSGTFLFVLSDFLAPPPASAWLAALGRRWEVVPVVIQDPVWEASFPLIGPLVVPVADAREGGALDVRFTRREARSRRSANELRHARLLDDFAALGLDPVVLEDADPAAVDRAFLEWAELRRRLRNR
jgi:uncharacterized protein (DUF58 family)